MVQAIYSTSGITTNAVLSARLWQKEVPEGATLIVNVDFLGYAANGKQISGKARRVFTNIAGTATPIAALVDPYLQKTGSGFPDNALTIDASTDNVQINVAQPSGFGNTNWNITITYLLA